MRYLHHLHVGDTGAVRGNVVQVVHVVIGAMVRRSRAEMRDSHSRTSPVFLVTGQRAGCAQALSPTGRSASQRYQRGERREETPTGGEAELARATRHGVVVSGVAQGADGPGRWVSDTLPPLKV